MNPMSKRTKIIIIVVVIVIIIGGTIYFIHKSKKAKAAKAAKSSTAKIDSSTMTEPTKVVKRSVARDVSGAAILKDNKPVAASAE